MPRIRSPAYPSFNLEEAIEFARKIHAADRQHPVPREVAATHMGFSGTTGSSDRGISALVQFGLAEKASKGELKISDLALRLLHPADDEERKEALSEAAFNPSLFQELRARYPGRPPAAATLESFLSRQNFAAIAIKPATKAFLETCRYLQQEGAYENYGDQAMPTPVSIPEQEVRELKIVHTPPLITPTLPPSVIALRSDIFTLEGGGEIVAKLPESLSQRDYDDLADWLELIRKKAERKIVRIIVNEEKQADD